MPVGKIVSLHKRDMNVRKKIGKFKPITWKKYA